MIKLENVSKTFTSKKGYTEALKHVTMEVKKGEIYGVIGYSGAGKSTLIRCANLLETPTEGKVWVKGIELTNLPSAQLRNMRQKIGMIFQGFNLLKTATVYENIALPLQLTGVPKQELQERVSIYLSVVGLEDKHEAYPNQLSGGQKQRVAIARALSHEPEILLSDEATSALDPETTEAILDLLLKINQEFGITILLITHEMNVISKICDRVAVLENGQLIEQGSVLHIFSNPEKETTQKFVQSVYNESLPDSLISHLKDKGPIVHLTFVGECSGEPAVAAISKKFNIYPNILSANIMQLKEESFGRLTVHLNGRDEETNLAIQYLKNQGIKVEGVVTDERQRMAVSS